MIWGEQPSGSALRAKAWFLEQGIKSVLVPGAGYGRNTKVFSSQFDTYGIELSSAALKLAVEWDSSTRFIEGSALEPQLEHQVDAVYCYDVLHLFLAGERYRLIDAALAQLRPGGLLYFTSFSDEDPNYGCGRRLEPGTYEYKEGKYAHFLAMPICGSILPEQRLLRPAHLRIRCTVRRAEAMNTYLELFSHAKEDRTLAVRRFFCSPRNRISACRPRGSDLNEFPLSRDRQLLECLA